MTDVLIARHGQSEWNALGRWQGQADPPLSPLGERQARHAAIRLEGIEVVVASDLRRAEQTARLIADAVGLDRVDLDNAFRERHAGEWQGLTKQEIEAAWPGYLAEGRRPPGFETDESLSARTDEGLDEVLRRHAGRRVLVVSHGGVIYRREQMLGASAERIPNLGGRWFHHRYGQDALDDLELGSRVVLVGEDEVTVPTQL
jgi:broad specificity phosphatase PhoE